MPFSSLFIATKQSGETYVSPSALLLLYMILFNQFLRLLRNHPSHEAHFSRLHIAGKDG